MFDVYFFFTHAYVSFILFTLLIYVNAYIDDKRGRIYWRTRTSIKCQIFRASHNKIYTALDLLSSSPAYSRTYIHDNSIEQIFEIYIEIYIRARLHMNRIHLHIIIIEYISGVLHRITNFQYIIYIVLHIHICICRAAAHICVCKF